MPTLNRKKVTRRYSVDGAIDINATDVILAGGGAVALTLADPPASPHWNGHQMSITCKTAQAHTITNTTGFNGGGTASDVLTLDAIGDSAILEAWDGVWYAVNLQGSALS